MLYRAILLTTFGRNSQRPLRAAIYRVGSVFGTAAGIGWLLGLGLAEIPLTPLPDAAYLFFVEACIVQCIVLFALLASFGLIRINNSDTFTRLLLLWPLTQTQRWLALLLPSFVVAIVTTTLLSWPLAICMLKLGLHPLLLLCGLGVGAIAGLGAVHGVPRRMAWTQVVGIPLLLGSEYSLLRVATSPVSSPPTKAIAGCALSLLLGYLCWLLLKSCTRLERDASQNTPAKTVPGISLPDRLWHVKKVARSKTTQLGFLASIGMSSALAILFHRYTAEPFVYALLAAIMAAAFCSDMRPLSRRVNPPEIVALRATRKYLLHLVLSALFYGLIVVLPLLVGLVLRAATPLELLHFFTQLLFGIGTGIFAGVLIVPHHRDVLGQLTATLLCVGLLTITPYIPFVRSLSTIAMTLLETLVALLLGCMACAIEYKRNTYIWSKQ